MSDHFRSTDPMGEEDLDPSLVCRQLSLCMLPERGVHAVYDDPRALSFHFCGVDGVHWKGSAKKDLSRMARCVVMITGDGVSGTLMLYQVYIPCLANVALVNITFRLKRRHPLLSMEQSQA